MKLIFLITQKKYFFCIISKNDISVPLLATARKEEGKTAKLRDTYIRKERN
jgi:hypothetical protein